MHEGEVIEEDAIELGKPLGIPGYAGVEYPPAVDPQRPRPRPTVVAYGRTTSFVQHEDGSVNAKRFLLIGAYDGDAAGIGRVVVDSTWHHWFSVNLVGLRTGNPAAYRRMQAYYRNVGLAGDTCTCVDALRLDVGGRRLGSDGVSRRIAGKALAGRGEGGRRHRPDGVAVHPRRARHGLPRGQGDGGALCAAGASTV